MKNRKNATGNYIDVSNGYSWEKTQLILSWIGTHKKVLDIGCFDGRDSLLIKRASNEVYGIDRMKKALNKATKRGIKTYFLDLEKEKWPFKKEFFDVVLAGEIIEHLVDVDSFLINIKKVLKPQGTLILSTPNLASLGRRLLLLLGKNPYTEVSKYEEVNGFFPAGHLRYFVKDSLLSLLKYHGFCVEEITSDSFYFGWGRSKMMAKLFPTLSWRLIVKARKKT